MNNAIQQKRMDEFIRYHIHGDGDCNGQTLRAYAQMKQLDREQAFALSYFYSVTYCCASAVFLLQNQKSIESDPVIFAQRTKELLVFQSDRKYVRMMNTFERLLSQWTKSVRYEEELFRKRTNADSGCIDTSKALDLIQRWYFFSRFSAYLFLETYCDILSLKATRASGLDYEGDSLTFAGGLCYVFGRDKEARHIQRFHRLPFSVKAFERMIWTLQTEVKRNGGDDSLVKLETSLCAYEKFFKGTRYNGFYADRMLGELNSMKTHAELRQAVEDVFSARLKAIPENYLGEKHGWAGIRPERKKSYIQTGRITGY